MRISISNIAWSPVDDEAVCRLLHSWQIDAIDIVPGKYFPEPLKTTNQEISAFRLRWQQQNISLVGMQSLLFGTHDLNMFGEAEIQKKMLNHLQALSRIAACLEIPALVFGSPKNRDRRGLSDDVTLDIAMNFFLRLGDIANQEGVKFCLEANPECYGANFMTSSAEAAEIVRKVNHPAIKMQLDTGAISINNENIEEILEKNADIIGHIHLSEANLVPPGTTSVDHSAVANALINSLPHHIATIEMLEKKDETHLLAIDKTLAFVTHYYRNLRDNA